MADDNATLEALSRYWQTWMQNKPVGGVNVHPSPEGLRPSWIQEETIQPIPFGDIADPVSQLAFMVGPGAMRGVKNLLETAGSPAPRLGGMLGGGLGERGSVPLPDPQPWPKGKPLPPVELPFEEEPLVWGGPGGGTGPARGAAYLAYRGADKPLQRGFMLEAPEMTAGLTRAEKVQAYKQAVELLKSMQAKASIQGIKGLPDVEGLPSSADLLQLFETGKGTKDWYVNARQTIWDIFGSDGDLFIRIVAANSPNKRLQQNLDQALKVYAQYKATGDPFIPGMLPADKPNTMRAILHDPRDQLSGMKVSRFAANILGNPDPVTVDTWHSRLFGLSKKPSTNDYRFAAEWTRLMAEQLGVKPSEMQAAMWIGAKLLNPQRGEDAAQVALPLRHLIVQSALQHEPELKRVSGALGDWFARMPTSDRNRLLQATGIAGALAPFLGGAQKSEAGEAMGKFLDRLGVKDASPQDINNLAIELENAPGFGE